MAVNNGLTSSTVNRKKDDTDYAATPARAVKPLLSFIDINAKIWECTDTYGRSQIGKVFRKSGYKVHSSSIKTFDFLKDDINTLFPIELRPDVIITNPPFNKKDAFIARCHEYYKKYKIKWALLLPLTALEGVFRGRLFREMKKDIGLIIYDRRINYTKQEGIWFNSSWFCCGLLPWPLIFIELKKEFENAFGIEGV